MGRQIKSDSSRTGRAGVGVAVTLELAVIGIGQRAARYKRELREKRIADKAAADKAKITLAPVKWVNK